MAEYPIILSHNVLDGATFISGNEVTGHELEHMRDGNRHTWWEAPSTAAQTFILRAKNLILNSDFETDVNKWYCFLAGSAVGTIAANTTLPIDGVGDLLATATDVDASTKIMFVLAERPIFMKSGRTYRMSIVGLAHGLVRLVHVGFLTSVWDEDAAQYTAANLATSASGLYHDYTPISDGWYYPYIRFIENDVYQIDQVVCNEVRSIDTLIIDSGHTLRGAIINIMYRTYESGNWINVTTQGWSVDAPIYLSFTGTKALNWKIDITVLTSIPDISVAKVPLFYLGKRWTLPHYFRGMFDPHAEIVNEDVVTGERGISQHIYKFNQRVFEATLSHLSSADYENIKWFMEDTDCGNKPFFFIWQPTSNLNDILCLRLKKPERSVPYMSGNLRQWQFTAMEVVGKRILTT